jgi:hypothetical protein
MLIGDGERLATALHRKPDAKLPPPDALFLVNCQIIETVLVQLRARLAVTMHLLKKLDKTS